jgi:hypothetical protein
VTSVAGMTNTGETGSIPKEGEGLADFTLSLPAWLPLFVAAEVEAIYEVILEGSCLDKESVARRRRRLNCLAADERMKRVWTQLQKTRRYKYCPTGQFLHPANVDGLAQLCRELPTLHDAKTRQEFAL